MSASSGFVDFKAIKAAVSMEQVLAHYQLSARFKRGKKDSLSGPCPIHQGSNPNQFRVSLDKNCWNCFSECKCGGNVLDFVAKMESVDLNEAAHRMVGWFNLDLARINADAPESKTARAAANPPTPTRQGLRPPASPEKTPPPAPPSPEEIGVNKPLSFTLELDARHPYLAERKLSEVTVTEFGLGACAKGVMAQRIAIPIKNAEGRLVGYAGRWPGEPPDGRPKYRLPDGFKKSVEVYRLAEAAKEPPELPWVIVEGFFDAAKFWQMGIRKCVALMGSSLSGAQEALLTRHLTPTSQVVVVFDEDDSGRQGRQDIVRRLASRAFVRFVVFPSEGYKAEHLSIEEAATLGLLAS